ncbi:hypothetical protein AZE42_09733, partial [Rhizopogon vesiculosus]
CTESTVAPRSYLFGCRGDRDFVLNWREARFLLSRINCLPQLFTLTTTKDKLSTSTLDNKALASIRQAIATFLQRCDLQYMPVTLDEEFLNFRHIRSPPRPFDQMWICLHTAVCTTIDDIVGKGQDITHVYRFNERFTSCQPQADPVLSGLYALLRYQDLTLVRTRTFLYILNHSSLHTFTH